MKKNNIETEEDLEEFAKTNYEKYKNLMSKRKNIWKRYRRAKTKEQKSEILTEINNIQPTIKELRKYDKYCKDIKFRTECIGNNLNNFDKDIQKEKDNSKSLLSFLMLLFYQEPPPPPPEPPPDEPPPEELDGLDDIAL